MSEIGKYNYLKKYINNKKPYLDNSFHDFNLNEIQDTEDKLGFKFPTQLKEFWKEIGYGSLYKSKSGENHGLDNYIMDPSLISEILLDKENNGYMLPDIAEEIPDGYIPFFHVGNSSHFLFMQPNSENPNTVYEMDGSKVEDNFETFIYRLYYESPSYYLYLRD